MLLGSFGLFDGMDLGSTGLGVCAGVVWRHDSFEKIEYRYGGIRLLKKICLFIFSIYC